MIPYLEISFLVLAGILIGAITGLIPGIHINLVASFVLASSFIILNFHPISIASFIVAVTLTHIFVDSVPSIFLGAPEENTFLSVLPGHQMVLEGKGYEALVLFSYGGLFGAISLAILAPVFGYFLPNIFLLFKSIFPFILIFLSLYLISREKNLLLALVIFCLSGILGFLAFNLPVKEPLMPLLTGLFGISGIMLSLKERPVLKEQKIVPLNKIRLSKKEFSNSAFASCIAGPLCSFLPGIGAGHAAIIGSEIFEQTPRSFLFLTGALNTLVMCLSFVAAYAIGKARTGSAAAIQEIMGQITLGNIIFLLFLAIFCSILAFFISLFISRKFSKMISKISYQSLNIIVMAFLLFLSLIITNYLGILVLLTGTALGIFGVSSGCRRIQFMGCLIIPSILYAFY